ncbi:MAG: hypothetical protein LRY27_04130 [Chitinophagales bacterium]|nr:hypothetical protein [Chitinophagales bacterium]
MKVIFNFVFIAVFLLSCKQNSIKELPIYGYEYIETENGTDTILKPIPHIKATDQKRRYYYKQYL